MTDKQKKFADEFIRRGDAREAWVAAGFSGRSAETYIPRVLGREDVAQYIESRLGGSKDPGIAGRTEILRYLTRLLRGRDTGERERLRAAELLGKGCGLFSDKTREESSGVTIVDDVR